MAQSASNFECYLCQKGFSTATNRNKHIRNIHKEPLVQKETIHVLCLLCEEKTTSFKCHEMLLTHLLENHNINVQTEEINFENTDEFHSWKSVNKIDINYSFTRSIITGNNRKKQYFNCNRSDIKGFSSNCTKRNPRAAGSIKIKGICPSKFTVNFEENGSVKVRFVKTHVGHTVQLRSQKLSAEEKSKIELKLKAGVTRERILEDARKVEGNELERINLLTLKDLRYFSIKYNIEKKRDMNDMVAVAMKVEEWNSNMKNYAFLFKEPGKEHPILNIEDFVVGYMNATMEKKLMDFGRIICMDGTHCTNKKKWELTIMLVKDDTQAGFPVAFMVSNRNDQIIQEVFLQAIKTKIGEINPEYLMTDDDPRYYNAWSIVMGKLPRRLLCSWHVVKNWNIKGKAKIQDPDMKKDMKKEMRKILTETKVDNFIKIKDEYFKRLEDANETHFLDYLQKYYFQSENRIMMWAHCFRLNAGINTNMALESLNKILKYNKMKRNMNITIEKLLDLIEELVDDKMWRRITKIERPTMENYQDKIISQAHKEAIKIQGDDNVVEEGFGHFKVKSSTGDKFYNIYYNQICESDCRTIYCHICKICLHVYKCDCYQFAVRSTLCKHAHLVALYEREKSDCILASQDNEDSGYLCIEEPSTVKLQHQQEISEFVSEKFEENNNTKRIDEDTLRRVNWDWFTKNIKDADWDVFNDVMEYSKRRLNKKHEEIKDNTSRKRKVEKQCYYPEEKKKKM